jgi:hypothetical protein
MVRATRVNCEPSTSTSPPFVVADAGYSHQLQSKQSKATAPKLSSRPTAGCAKTSSRMDRHLYEFMRRVLATPAGPAIYRTRQITIEPLFRPAQVPPPDPTLPTPRPNRLPRIRA